MSSLAWLSLFSKSYVVQAIDGSFPLVGRALPTNGNEPSMAWTTYDLENKDSQAKLLTNGSIYSQIYMNPPFKRPPGVFMIN